MLAGLIANGVYEQDEERRSPRIVPAVITGSDAEVATDPVPEIHLVPTITCGGGLGPV
jgi:hypothetical protein